VGFITEFQEVSDYWKRFGTWWKLFVICLASENYMEGFDYDPGEAKTNYKAQEIHLSLSLSTIISIHRGKSKA
jgi:hypothetical protein